MFRNEAIDLFYRYREIHDLKQLIHSFFSLRNVKFSYVFHENVDVLWRDFTSCFTIIEAAGGLVRNSRGEILVMYRRGKWDLPKGKVDVGEESYETAIREVEEECGLSGLLIRKKIVETWHCYSLNEQHILKPTTWFEMEYPGNEKPVPQAEEEITDIQWISPASLGFLRENTFPSILEVLEKAGFHL